MPFRSAVAWLLVLLVTRVSAQEEAVELRRYEETDLVVVGDWISEAKPEYSGGEAIYANYDRHDPGASASLEFSGTAVYWIGARTHNAGFLDWVVDAGTPSEISGTLDTYAMEVDRAARVLLVDGLTPGEHRLRLTSRGENRFGGDLPSETYIDAIEVVVRGGDGDVRRSCPAANGVVINELVASNDGGLQDEDGESPDWFEIYNGSTDDVDLGGWGVTQDVDGSDAWRFPAGLTIERDTYIVIFASGKNRRTLGEELHTHFRLDRAGQFLGLVDARGELVHSFDPGYPRQTTKVSFGSVSGPSVVLVSMSAPARAMVPAGGRPEEDWTDPDFDDSTWLSGRTGVGYERGEGFGELLGLDVGETMFGSTERVRVRVRFDVEDPAAFERVVLRMKYDDGFRAFLNGVEVASANAPPIEDSTSGAVEERSDDEALAFTEFDVSKFADRLLAGENVLAIEGFNRGSHSDDLLILPELVACPSRPGETETGFFDTPTPGAANGNQSFEGVVSDTVFSFDRGFYDVPLDVAITTATEDARVLYTLDGKEPLPENPSARELGAGETIRVVGTSTIRAAAYREGFLPTNIDTHTYLYLDDIIRQSPNGETPPGWPTGPVSGQVFDYGMDPQIVDHPQWGPLLREGLVSVSTISIVTDLENLFHPTTGNYVHADGQGRAWERPVSMELIHPDGREGFQVEAGIRPRGNFSATGRNPKHAFRFFFRSEYGDAKLRYPLFGAEGTDEFKKLDLRTVQNDSWAYQNSEELTFIHDVYARDLQRDMGQPYTRSRYHQVYINGVYWGLYQTQERSEAAFGETYFGGRREDYDTIKATGGSLYATEFTDGNFDAWRELWTAVRSGVDDATYFRLRGLNPDGTSNESFPVLLDADNLIDFMIGIIYTGDEDRGLSLALRNTRPNNFFALRNRHGRRGFAFFAQDAEQSFFSNHNIHGLHADRVGPFTHGNWTRFEYSNPHWIHQDLMGSEEYRLRFADRVHKYFFHGGLLTRESVERGFERRAAEIEIAIVGESARWGDAQRSSPFTRDHWRRAIDILFERFLPFRQDIVFAQLRGARRVSAGGGLVPAPLYPSVDPPELDRRSGYVTRGTLVYVHPNGPRARGFYTTDGSDPRTIGGGVRDSAIESGGGEATTLVRAGAEVRVHVPTNGDSGLTWTGLTFNDAAWFRGPTGVGFDTGSNFDEFIETDVEQPMRSESSSAYLRLPFFVDEPEQFATVFLEMRYDDGFVAYLNGERVAAANAPPTLAWNSRATRSHDDSQAIVYESFRVPVTALRTGDNLLAIHGLNSSTSSGDFLILPRLTATGAGDAVEIDRSSMVLRARTFQDGVWSALDEVAFVTDTTSLRITEIMYHPAPASAREQESGSFRRSDFEFVELQNVGDRPINLTGISFYGIEFQFSDQDARPEEDLAPGEVVLVVKNRTAFESRYDTEGLRIAGEFGGNLSNGGEAIALRDRLGGEMLVVSYSDEWYSSSDGLGPSLEIRDDSVLFENWSDRASWRASEAIGGTPGVAPWSRSGGRQIPGDLNQDQSLNLTDAVALLLHLFQSPTNLPCGDTLTSAGNVALLDSNADGKINLSDPVHVLRHLFVGGQPPALGADCVEIPGCPDACDP